MKHLIRITALLVITSLLLVGCTAIPVQLEGEYTSLTPENAGEKDIKTAVRWGGVVLETKPEEDFTCFEILSRQLGRSMRPVYSDQGSGRFIACKPGFYDPEVFEKGREVTLTGEIIYMDTRKVGEHDYDYPVVNIEFMSLWPVRRNRVYVGVYDPFHPYYWHYPPGRFYFRYPHY